MSVTLLSVVVSFSVSSPIIDSFVSLLSYDVLSLLIYSEINGLCSFEFFLFLPYILI